MQSDVRFDALKTRVFKLFRLEQKNGKESYSFAGTGFLLSRRYLLTCKHVASDLRGNLIKVDNHNYEELNTVASCGDLDVELLRLPKDFVSDDVRPVPLARGVPWQKEVFPSNGCVLFGGSNMGPTTGISLITEASLDGKGLQFHGAGLEGYSGGPLVLNEFPELAIFGISVLGGERSVHTRATSSDLLIEWLQSVIASVPLTDLVVNPIPFEEVLKKIVFGDSDWTRPVEDQWFSNWAYARNPAGEHVSAESQGKRPLMIAGSPVKVLDSNTEGVVRAQGINTGSILYAELFEKYPQRFGQGNEGV